MVPSGSRRARLRQPARAGGARSGRPDANSGGHPRAAARAIHRRAGHRADHRAGVRRCRTIARRSSGASSAGDSGCSWRSRSSCCGSPSDRTLFRHLGRAITAVLHYSYAGSSFVFGELGKRQLDARRHLRLPDPPRDHLRLRAVRDALLSRRDAGRGARLRRRDDASCSARAAPRASTSARRSSWGRPRRRSPSGRSCRGMTQSELMTVMTAGMAHVSGLDHGGLHRLRRRGAAPAQRGDHDGARHHHDGEAVRAGDRGAGDLRQRQDRHSPRRT